MAKYKKSINLPKKYKWVDLSDNLYRSTLDKVLNTNKNLYINGAGGVGKSVMIELAYNLLKGNTLVLASTGIAAANLADKKIPAVTIHSGLRIPPLHVFDSNIKVDKEVVSLLLKINTIIIEEVSMISAALFDQVARVIGEANKWRSIPIRILMFGDILQFAPVVQRNDETIKRYYFNKYNGNIYFFNSLSFNKLKFETINLERIYRQESESLQENLMKIRLSVQDDSTLDYFNQRVMSLNDFTNTHKNFLVISTTKKREQYLNDTFGIPNKSAIHKTFKAKREGEFNKNELSTVDDEITIYVGQQIMCLCNNFEKGYQNGTLAKVTDIFEDKVVAIKSNYETITIGINKWEQFGYNYNEETDEVEASVIGTYSQIGCKPAFAVTFHKAQGMTLESIYLDLESFWVPTSAIYVGLSRCKTLEGIGISRKITDADIKIEPEAIDFFLDQGELDVD